MEQQSTDIASCYEKNHKVFKKRMETVLEYFEKYGDWLNVLKVNIFQNYEFMLS